MPIVTVWSCHLSSHERKIDQGRHAPQWMLGANALIEIDLLVEQFDLRLMNTHHKDVSLTYRSNAYSTRH
jgi:hypothetical protein